MNEAARIIQQKMSNREGEVFFDPLTLSIIAGVLSVIFNALRIFMLFRKQNKESAGEVIHNNCYYETPRIRRMIRRAVRRKLSRVEYSKHGNELCNAILDYGAKTRVHELQTLYDGVPKDEYTEL